MRNPQTPGMKGSLKWIQVLINNHPEVINKQLGSDVEWLSPLASDDYAEYRDSAFLKLLGLDHLQSSLKDFWPNRGPQWDALGKSSSKYFLIEAKANLPEIKSSCSAKSENSIAMIKKAISQTKLFFNAGNSQGWTEDFYQYANRLAHLYFLREICGVEAELVFVYFCDDYSHISTSLNEWNRSLTEQKRHMGLSNLIHTHEIFIKCQELR